MRIVVKFANNKVTYVCAKYRDTKNELVLYDYYVDTPSTKDEIIEEIHIMKHAISSYIIKEN